MYPHGMRSSAFCHCHWMFFVYSIYILHRIPESERDKLVIMLKMYVFCMCKTMQLLRVNQNAHFSFKSVWFFLKICNIFNMEFWWLKFSFFYWNEGVISKLIVMSIACYYVMLIVFKNIKVKLTNTRRG